MNRKEHLTMNGIIKIVSIKASINNGLSETLKSDFPDINPIPKSLVNLNPEKIEPNWLVGFVDGEGCFMISIYKDKTKTGFTPKLTFQITQHSRDAELMDRCIKIFGCGWIKKENSKPAVRFTVTKFRDIDEKIIPFFKKYSLKGSKKMNFADFCKAADIIRVKDHLTKDGLDKIINIKAGMNKGRK